MSLQDYNKTIAAILPVPCAVSNGYELWVGQNRRTIAIIDATTLEPIKYLSCSHDNSSLPQYLSDSYVNHFALDVQTQPLPGQERGHSLYSALFSGQVVTRWCTVARQHKATYNVTKCMGEYTNCRVIPLYQFLVHMTVTWLSISVSYATVSLYAYNYIPVTWYIAQYHCSVLQCYYSVLQDCL